METEGNRDTRGFKNEAHKHKNETARERVASGSDDVMSWIAGTLERACSDAARDSDLLLMLALSIFSFVLRPSRCWRLRQKYPDSCLTVVKPRLVIIRNIE